MVKNFCGLGLDRYRRRRYTRSLDRKLNPIKLMTLTKRDLVTRISEETGLTQQQVLDVVQKTLDYIGESLAKGDKVELRNFGVFEVKTRKARVGRNPNAPETDVPIPARSVVKFKAGKEMAAAVIKLPPVPTA
jgi:nucleoid DNA-binding protein